MIVTSGHDRSVRAFFRSEELIFADEQRLAGPSTTPPPATAPLQLRAVDRIFSPAGRIIVVFFLSVAALIFLLTFCKGTRVYKSIVLWLLLLPLLTANLPSSNALCFGGRVNLSI